MKLDFSRQNFEKYSDVGFHSGALNLNYHDVEHEDCNLQGYDAVYYAKSVRCFERACCLQLHWAPSGFTALSLSIIQIYHVCYTCSCTLNMIQQNLPKCRYLSTVHIDVTCNKTVIVLHKMQGMI
jgi:hypothetical protein